MQNESDAQLLRAYAEQGNEAAFREIVVRHGDLIYSSALRQVTSPDLARDVAQGVFMDLARKAKSLLETLPENGSLLGWLYRSTRFAALTFLRDERRRQNRERQLMDEFDPTPDTAPEWDLVRPVLDEAMADLTDEDREALLWRFFKNHDFRTIGAALGISDDAAQKRVSRALDRLRVHLTRRDVKISALALATLLPVHTVQAAPAGLIAILGSAATLTGSALTTTTTAAATKAIAMTTLQKTLVAAILAVAVGTGIYEHRQASNLRTQVQALQERHSQYIEQLQGDANDATRQLAALREENERQKRNADDIHRLRGEVTRLRMQAQELVGLKANDSNETDLLAKSWMAKVNLLKNYVEQNPGETIPELQFITEREWLSSIDPSASYWPLESEKHYDRAMHILRDSSQMNFWGQINNALRQFHATHNRPLPTELALLHPHCEPLVAEVLVQEYEIAPARNLPANALPNDAQVNGDWVIRRKTPASQNSGRMYVVPMKGRGTTYYHMAFH